MTVPIELAEVSFRRGTVDDAAELAGFAARAFSETYSADNRAEDMAAYLADSYGPAQQTEELADLRISTLLARARGELLAYAQVAQNSPPRCVTQVAPLELHRFYVDRQAHGTGLASMLMQEVFEAARERDARHLWLSVWERNPRAIAFYKKATFFDVGSTVFRVGRDMQTDRVLVCAIPSRALDTD